MSDEATGRGRKQLVVIMSIALLTLGGSYLLFYVASAGSGWGTTNKGAFVQPPTRVEELDWSVPAEERRVWWLWIVAQRCLPGCDGALAESARDLRALHVLLNREARRVRRGITAPSPGAWRNEFERMVDVESRVPPAGDGVYIVDPNGNLVLHYPLEGDPEDVLTDLKRLLKVSQIG